MKDPAKQKKKIYCAIYTRKSTSEGLDQDFTSLDAQRESAESYINSQKSEGWAVLPDRYDDGGYTGANTERPALQKLLKDISNGKIDCVVVYKVDRLSRSLLDFTQLLEFFEKNDSTFVSVTQHFNTNSSMGRLTLNILLSFAQFEREIISERTKDKMAAARKKGKWVGGKPILGYDLCRETKRIFVNEDEAGVIRRIFGRYIEKRSALEVVKELNESGITTKKHTTLQGKVVGGKRFTNTGITQILKNVIYLGKVKYSGELYAGLHDRIISDETFNKAQEILSENRVSRIAVRNTKTNGLLTQLARCRSCNSPMSLTYTKKPSQKAYRYYICMRAQKEGRHICPTKSVSAQHFEDQVIDCLKKIAADTEEKQKRVELLRKQLESELDGLSSQQDKLTKEIDEIVSRMQEIKVLIVNSESGNEQSVETIKGLQEKLQDNERHLSTIRVEKSNIEDKIITKNELNEALIINSPVWDTLFPIEKKRILRLLLKEVDYDGSTQKMGLALSEKGLKILCSEIQGAHNG